MTKVCLNEVNKENLIENFRENKEQFLETICKRDGGPIKSRSDFYKMSLLTRIDLCLHEIYGPDRPNNFSDLILEKIEKEASNFSQNNANELLSGI